MSELDIARIKKRIDEEEILGNKQTIKKKGTRKRIFREIWDWSDGGGLMREHCWWFIDWTKGNHSTVEEINARRKTYSG